MYTARLPQPEVSFIPIQTLYYIMRWSTYKYLMLISNTIPLPNIKFPITNWTVKIWFLKWKIYILPTDIDRHNKCLHHCNNTFINCVKKKLPLPATNSCTVEIKYFNTDMNVNAQWKSIILTIRDLNLCWVTFRFLESKISIKWDIHNKIKNKLNNVTSIQYAINMEWKFHTKQQNF